MMIGLLNVLLLLWYFVVIVCACKPQSIPLSVIVSCLGFTLCIGILAILDKLS